MKETPNNATQKALVQLEFTFQCCGFRDVTDMVYPDNCLEIIETTVGCAEAVKGNLQGSLGTIGAAGVVIGVIELIGLVFSAILFRKIAQREQAAGSLLNEAWRINRNKIQYGYQNYQYV